MPAAGALGPVADRTYSGLIRVRSNAELEKDERVLARARKTQTRREISNMAQHVYRRWYDAREAKQDINVRLLNALKQRRGMYDDTKLSKIREQTGSEVFMQVTGLKCWALKSWLTDILFRDEFRMFQLKPSPVPDLNDDFVNGIVQAVMMDMEQKLAEGQEINPFDALTQASEMRDRVMQEMGVMAKDAARRMQLKIYDQFVEGNFFNAFDDFLDDFTTFPCAFMKGPVYRNRPRLVWEDSHPVIKNVIREEYERASSFDMYPSAESTTINEGYLCEHMRLERRYLLSCKGVSGFDSDAIDLVIFNNRFQTLNDTNLEDWNIEHAREVAEDRRFEDYTENEMIDAVDYWGSVPGWMLQEMGIKVEESRAEYEVNAWLVDNVIVRTVLNKDPLHRRPYFKASFRNIPGSFWGQGVPDVMTDVQDTCNNAIRSLNNNMAIASFPQVEVLNMERLSADEDLTDIFPGKIWPMSDTANTSQPNIRFFQPLSNAGELMTIYDRFTKIADDHTGVPAYAHGDTDVGGAGNTMGGLSMMMGSAGRGVKQSLRHIFSGLISPLVRMQYDSNMLFLDDDSLKGDVVIKPSGIMSILMQEQKIAQRENLLSVSNNEVDNLIFGHEGRRSLWEQHLRDSDLDVEDIIPTKEELDERLAQLSEPQEEQNIPA